MTGWCSCNNSCTDCETVLWFFVQVGGEKVFRVVHHQLQQKRKSCRRASETEWNRIRPTETRRSVLLQQMDETFTVSGRIVSVSAEHKQPAAMLGLTFPQSCWRSFSSENRMLLMLSENKCVFLSCTSSSYLHLKRRTFYSTTLNWGLKLVVTPFFDFFTIWKISLLYFCPVTSLKAVIRLNYPLFYNKAEPPVIRSHFLICTQLNTYITATNCVLYTKREIH